MSVSKTQLQDFAKLVKNHPAFDAIIERVQKSLFMASLGASKEERSIISDQMDALGLLKGEINVVFETIDEDKSINDDPDEDA